jgi:hypothetical protein
VTGLLNLASDIGGGGNIDEWNGLHSVNKALTVQLVPNVCRYL